MSELNFTDLTPITLPVTIGDQTYQLHEATGDVAAKYRNAIIEATKFGPDGKPAGFRGLADTEMLLISLCLKQDNQPVPMATIRGLPSRIIKALFNKAREISDLEEAEDRQGLEKQLKDVQEKLTKLDEENPAKNALSNTTDG